MSLASFFAWLYPLVPVIGFMAYIPQIVKLYRDPDSARSFSLPTWTLWLIGSIVSAGYGACAIQSAMVCGTFIMHTVMQAGIIGFVLYRRYDFSLKELTVRAQAQAEIA